MPQVREAIREGFAKEAAKLRKTAKEYENGRVKAKSVGMPPTLPKYAEVYISQGGVTIFVPNDPAMLNYVRARFQKFGWEVGPFENSDYGSYLAEARLPDKDDPDVGWKDRNSTRIIALDTKEGATCRTVKIGTVLEEVDVWETRCTEEDE